MAAITTNKLTNANIYVDGNSFLGKAMEIELPTVQHKMAEHQALGMVGMTEMFAGIEKMTGKIKWNSFYRDAALKIADPTKAFPLQLRGSLETFGAGGREAQVPFVAYLTASFTSFPLGNFKQAENVELESDFTASYCKLEINGEAIVEIDVLANIYKVGGVDIMAIYRANIGQ